MNSSTPFFVVGSVRSGTTLLRLMLGQHSQICRCEEMDFITGDLIDANIMRDPSQYVRKLRLHRGFRLSGYDIDESLTFPEMAESFLAQRRAMDEKPLFGATVHHHFDHLPQLWPDARFIYLRRDPRDVSRSCVQMGWAGSTWHASDFWINAEEAWTKLDELVPQHNRMVIKFEDLVSECPARLQEICGFLDVEYEPDMMEIEFSGTYSRPDPKNARSWKTDASADEIAQVETRLGPERIKAAGYALSGNPLLSVNAYQRSRIALQNVCTRVAFRAERYGMGLWLQGVISRRLPFRNLRERIQIRIDRIDNLHMK